VLLSLLSFSFIAADKRGGGEKRLLIVDVYEEIV
jgi:hypothetical protein